VNVARLVVPSIRWRDDSGFDHEASGIDAALAAGVGGFIVFGGPAERVAALTADLRARSATPLLIGADLERGAGQQFAGLREIPPPAALASLGDLAVVEAAGFTTAVDARSVGVDWVFAPVADLDVEPENPIVQTRAFGGDPAAVAKAVTGWIRGAAAGGALGCAKHFPGHGRTTRDSHDHLCRVETPADILRATDLVPFAAAIEAGVDSVMTCHVAFGSLDPVGRPATLSPPILQLLRSMGFVGLIVSDALIMEGVRAGGADPAVAALAAGLDILLYPPDPAATIAALRRAVADDPRFAATAAASLGRLDAALGRAASLPAGAGGLDVAGLADRLLAAGPAVRLEAPIELIVADDDLDGAFPASSNRIVAETLSALGVPLGTGGSRILLAFAEPRASKGRGGFGARTLATIAAADPCDLAVAFTGPRLMAALSPAPPTLLAWHRQRLMQEAVGRWLAQRLG